MKKMKDNTEQLTRLLEKEVEQVNKFIEVESLIMDSVKDYNWDALESAIKQSGELSFSIENIDKKREKCINILREEAGMDADAHFYRLTINLESKKKKRINDLYRDLKLSVLNLQNMNWRINTYVSTVTGIMQRTLKEIYPHRRGSLYSKLGKIKEAGNNPMVLNRNL